jgi:hypothetical protein
MHVCMLPSSRDVNDVPLIIAGSLGILAAAIHGLGGEALVVRKLSLDTLPSTSFGGPKTTKLMIHVSWHITTVAFLAVGTALILSGSALDGDEAQALALLGACAASGVAAVVLVLSGTYRTSVRTLIRHPGPLVPTATAAIAWWGVL